MECSKKISKDINQFMEDADLNEAFLFGGAVLDPLLKEDAKINDYDLCVKSEEDFYMALDNLSSKNIEISEVMRTHNIYVVIKHPQLGQIDFSCMDPEDNGIFNIEKIYARFTRSSNGFVNEIVDNYGAVDGMSQGKIRISSNPRKEGAYNVLRRFLAITGKYNLDISKDGPNQSTIDLMNSAFSAGYHYIPQDKVRCLSRVVASLRRSKDRSLYVKNLGEQNVLKYAFSEIHRLFNTKEFQNNQQLNQCATQQELLELILAHVEPNARDDMLDCLLLLDKREKARQDKGVKTFVDNIASEKTSPQRLSNKIILPILLSAKEKSKRS